MNLNAVLIAALLMLVLGINAIGVVHKSIGHASPSHAHGFWKKKWTWKARWVKTWRPRKVWVATWKRVWGPVEISEYVPLPKSVPRISSIQELPHY